MRNIILIASLLALSGCLSSAPKSPTKWDIAVDKSEMTPGLKVNESAMAVVRVRGQYNNTHFAVLRKDGTIAYDAFNAFPATPKLLIKNVMQDVYGLSDTVSNSKCKYIVEVDTFAIDCRAAGQRDAVVELKLTVIDNDNVVYTGEGKAAMPTSDRNFGAAFSKAITKALCQAAEGLK